jgi:ATP-dependent Lon protease
MYDNTHFKTREDAIQHGIEEYEAGVRVMSRQLEQLEGKVSEIKNDIVKEQGFVDYLKGLKK